MKLEVASPCRESWDRMHGDARSRHCSRCSLNVYNLSAMSRAEAEALIREKEGRLCVRFFQRKDGTVMTRDCPVGQRERRIRRFSWAAVAAALAVLTLTVATALSTRSSSISKGEYPQILRTVMKWLGHKEAPPVREWIVGKLVPPPLPPPPPAPPEEK